MVSPFNLNVNEFYIVYVWNSHVVEKLCSCCVKPVKDISTLEIVVTDEAKIEASKMEQSKSNATSITTNQNLR